MHANKMKLYHYTKFSNFCSIWIQQKLKFSEWTNSNDVYEREKIYNFTQHSKECSQSVRHFVSRCSRTIGDFERDVLKN